MNKLREKWSLNMGSFHQNRREQSLTLNIFIGFLVASSRYQLTDISRRGISLRDPRVVPRLARKAVDSNCGN